MAKKGDQHILCWFMESTSLNPSPAQWSHSLMDFQYFQMLLAHELIILLEAKPYDPQVKYLWWNEKHFCTYHQN